ncbi:hypothetical protein PV10_04033 [Exophiala mesophila]|uniref:Uncharacterized protein n=1 Tax=Exophiala mesophila TaxID=212818 RepID=A0A0D1XX01_EXOME|nr:uncharacterized protein PV10_04033 [Exophiala mesophila]KIV92766.1 hypothetical protein PV10_04033 [Exophiala mesophila]
MSPRPATEENTMTRSSGSPNFFESVDPAGFPANDKEKARPWMALLAARQDASRKPGAVDKMNLKSGWLLDASASILNWRIKPETILLSTDPTPFYSYPVRLASFSAPSTILHFTYIRGLVIQRGQKSIDS